MVANIYKRNNKEEKKSKNSMDFMTNLNEEQTHHRCYMLSKEGLLMKRSLSLLTKKSIPNKTIKYEQPVKKLEIMLKSKYTKTINTNGSKNITKERNKMKDNRYTQLMQGDDTSLSDSYTDSSDGHNQDKEQKIKLRKILKKQL
mmetsp:Transcript_12113/g.10734  ORF Transcript_12113/g.10734 Transcript_12113/m.10734 type:complete len:144 (+) Transcript_12113:761-1192(+)